MEFLEAFRMALAAIVTNKLRSFLTLIGIIAGVASIIAVMTGISVIQKNHGKGNERSWVNDFPGSKKCYGWAHERGREKKDCQEKTSHGGTGRCYSREG